MLSPLAGTLDSSFRIANGDLGFQATSTTCEKQIGEIGMIKVSQSVVINCPVKEVFEFISNPDNAPQWVSGIHQVKRLSKGPLKVGTKARQVRRFLGRELGADYEVTHFEQNKRVDVKVITGPLAGFGVAESVAPAPGEDVERQTVVTFVGQGEIGGSLRKVFKLAEPVLSRMYERQLQADLGHLKDLLEAKNG